jgi:hypothetical protein
METRMLWLALSGLAMVSCAKGDDSSGNGDDGAGDGGGGDESDADTDADSDTDSDSDTDADTDADTDVQQGWDADTLQVDASFGFDATTGTIHTMTYLGSTLANTVSATIYNAADLATANPTQFCFVTWTLPEGAIAANGAFTGEYWMSFDLSDADITYTGATSAGGPTGDCEGMQSFLGTARGSADLESFAATFGIGFGVQSLADVATAIVTDWRTNTWPTIYAPTYGAWNTFSPAFAAGSFTMQGSTPNETDLMMAFVVDEESWDVPSDPKTGVSNLVTMTGLTAPPTGYYQSLAMYSFSGSD